MHTIILLSAGMTTNGIARKIYIVLKDGHIVEAFDYNYKEGERKAQAKYEGLNACIPQFETTVKEYNYYKTNWIKKEAK